MAVTFKVRSGDTHSRSTPHLDKDTAFRRYPVFITGKFRQYILKAYRSNVAVPPETMGALWSSSVLSLGVSRKRSEEENAQLLEKRWYRFVQDEGIERYYRTAGRRSDGNWM